MFFIKGWIKGMTLVRLYRGIVFLIKLRGMKMNYKEVKGDLLLAHPEKVIAHCIAEDAIMGAGIAKQIRNKLLCINRTIIILK